MNSNNINKCIDIHTLLKSCIHIYFFLNDTVCLFYVDVQQHLFFINFIILLRTFTTSDSFITSTWLVAIYLPEDNASFNLELERSSIPVIPDLSKIVIPTPLLANPTYPVAGIG